MPPKTTLQNFNIVPHIEQVLAWFIENDKQVSLVSTPLIKQLFDQGYRPVSSPWNDPADLESEGRKHGETANIHIVERWLLIRTYMDLAAAEAAAKKGIQPSLGYAIKYMIDVLDKYGSETLFNVATIIHKYNLDTSVNDRDKELSKIKTDSDREILKQNFLADTLTAAEIRILAWFYRELFNKDFKFEAIPISQPGVSESGAKEPHASQITKSSAEKMKLLKGVVSILISIGLLILIRNFFTGT